MWKTVRREQHMVITWSILSGERSRYFSSVWEASFHSADASKLAEELHVKNLLLYHTERQKSVAEKRTLSKWGKKVFNGTIFVPEDLETLVL